MAIRLEVPAFAYDYINGTSGTYSNTPYASKYYPSYTGYNYNSYIPKANMPAFVCNANYGVCGQGFTYYMYTSSASAEIQSNIPTFKDITMTWSQAIPIIFGCPIGLCWFNFYASVYNNNEPVPNYYSNFTTNNIGFFVNSDHKLAFGGHNWAGYRPIVDIDFGIDMTPYMYTPAVQNSAAYCGHTYGIRYNAEGDALDLYVDNVETILASVTFNQIMRTAMNVINYFHSWDSLYNAWVNYGGCIQNIYAGGCGLYVSNTSGSYNVYNQGNVYFDSWYTWVHNLNDVEFNAAMNHSFSMLPSAKNYSSYGIMEHCNMLTTINIPGTVGVIPKPFIRGNNINLVIFGEGITRISEQAVLGNVPLTIHVPQTAVDISNHAFRSDAGVNIPAVSYNMLERGDIASRYNTTNSLNIPAYELPHYEQPVELNIGWFPGSVLPVSRSNQFRNIPGVINIPQVQHTFIENNGVYDMTTNTVSGSVVFDQNVNQEMHCNLLGVHTLRMNDTTATVDIFSREFPNIHEVRDVGIIDDHGFIIDQTGTGTVDILGHINGQYDIIPDNFESHYLTRQVFINNLTQDASTTQFIKVPNIIANYNYVTNDRDFYEALQVYDFGKYSDISFYDGHAVILNTPNTRDTANMHVPTIHYAFSNISVVYINHSRYDYAAQTTFTYSFENCNQVYIPYLGFNRPVNLQTLLQLNSIPQQTKVENEDWSAADVEFNNFYTEWYNNPNAVWETPYHQYKLYHRDELPLWLNSNIALVYNNNYNRTINDLMYEESARNMYRSNAVASAVWTSHFDNITFPGNITLRNMLTQRPYFNNCSGDCNFIIRNMISPVLTAGLVNRENTITLPGPALACNHHGILNFDIDVNRVVVANSEFTSSDEPLGMTGSPLWLAHNCEVGYVKLNYSDNLNLSPTELQLVKHAEISGYGIAFDNCNIDTIECGANCSIQLANCNINNIIYHGGPVQYLGFINSNIRCSIQPLLNNLVNYITINNSSFVDTDMTIPYNVAGYIHGWAYSSADSLGAMYIFNPKGVHNITIIDKVNEPRIGSVRILLSDGWGTNPPYGHDVQKIHLIGRVSPSFAIYDYKGRRPVDIIIDSPEVGMHNSITPFFGQNNDHAFNSISMPNTVAIGPNTFYNINVATPIQVHALCSVHPNAASTSSTISYTYGNGNKYATGINASYISNRQRDTAPMNYGSIRNMLSINVVYNDGTEEPTDEFTIWPDFGIASNANMFHTVQLKNVCGIVPAPYNSIPSYKYTASQYNAVTTVGTWNQYMSFWDADLDLPICVVYASPTGTYSTRGNFYQLNVANKYKHTLVITGNYANGPYNARLMSDIIDMNYGRNNSAWSYLVGLRGVVRNVNFITNMNNYIQSFSGSEHTVILSPGRPSKVFGHRSFVNSGVAQIYAPFMRDTYNGALPYTITGSKYINSWAINNAQYLYHIDFNYFAGQYLYINANAVINAPMLKYLTLPRNTKSVGIGAFNRTGLKEVKIPTGCTVSTNAFPADCTITYY